MAQLITAADIITNAFTNNTVDPNVIKDNFIEIAQEEHIFPVLGEDLYDEIVDQNNTASLTAENTTLLDTYIKPALAFYVKYEILDDMSVNTTDKGLQIPESDFSRAANSEERADMKNKAKKHGDTLADKMTRFLKDSTDYPLYSNGINQRNQVTVKGGVILRSRDRFNCIKCGCEYNDCNCSIIY